MAEIVSTSDAIVRELRAPSMKATVPVSASTPQDPLVLSGLALRKAVGIIGFAVPIVLAFGNMILLKRLVIESSISSYYYTGMGNVFVGSLCAIGVFLMSTRGYDRKDEIAGRLACAFAIGVALFRTTLYSDPTSKEKLIGSLHWLFAALLFLTLGYFCLALFTKTAPDRIPTPPKTPEKCRSSNLRTYHPCEHSPHCSARTASQTLGAAFHSGFLARVHRRSGIWRSLAHQGRNDPQRPI
jgi:hypothetical protein